MSQVEATLVRLGLELPPVSVPSAAYVPAVTVGNLVFLSGQTVTRMGQPLMQGHVGNEFTVEEGYEGARLCGLNALAVLKQEIGNLDRVQRIVKVLGWVNSAPGFDRQPEVMNGFSELMEQVFGEKGRHARSAIGTNELPHRSPVEVEMIVQSMDSPNPGRWPSQDTSDASEFGIESHLSKKLKSRLDAVFPLDNFRLST